MNKLKVESYDKLAYFYDQLQSEMDYSVWQNWLIKVIGNDEVCVLEVGCGTGKIANFLNINAVKIDAFDLSPQMIAVAKSKYSEINFFVDDVVKFKCSKQYDLVIIFMDTINYLTDDILLDRAFKNIFDACKEGGQVLFDIHIDDNQELFDDYYESGFINQIEYKWSSYLKGNDLVVHEFEFIDGENIYFEQHQQLMRKLEYYRAIYTKYFDEISVETDQYRHYVTLKKENYA